MTEPRTTAGQSIAEIITPEYEATVDVLDILAIEAEAAALERERLRERADLQSHFAMDHDGEFDDCDHSSCMAFRWLLETPA